MNKQVIIKGESIYYNFMYNFLSLLTTNACLAM